jgi:hypothetical protein
MRATSITSVTSATRLALAGALAVSACGKPPAPGPGDAAPAPTIAAAPVLDAGPRPVATMVPHPPPPPCRAIRVVGAARASDAGGGAPIRTGDAVDRWVTLDPATKVTVKEPSSARELLFTGAAGATFLACYHENEAWLASGEFVGTRGLGERPGADQWVVTPFAVVRYGGATVDVTVDRASTRAVLQTGSAQAIASDGDAWHALDPSSPFVAKGALDEAGNAAAANRCVSAETAAKALEDALLAPGETQDSGFGELARRATEARTLARAACSISALRAAQTR